MKLLITGKDTFMGKQLNPLEKEFLVRKYRSNLQIKLGDFCNANHISDSAFKKGLKQYEKGGLDGFARADASLGMFCRKALYTQ